MIIAIGGGEIGRPGKPIETLTIDQRIIALSRKLNPNLLFIPTASNDALSYQETVENYFGKILGCAVSHLLQTNSNPEEMILSSDIIYVGGGNTKFMLERWRELGIDKALMKAHKKGIILSGISAGAMCWFEEGISEKSLITCLGMVKGVLAIHCQNGSILPKPCIGLSNCSALFIDDNGLFEVVLSKEDGFAKFYSEKKKEILVLHKRYNLMDIFSSY